ncbi:MAG: DUF2911 domain-containing protein [Chitinophagaceae bacterium]|nr:DUF2911 domain-containing protein [Chitinophagaceae bacterium]
MNLLRSANVLLLVGILGFTACNNKPVPAGTDNADKPAQVPQVAANPNGLIDQSPMDIIYYPIEYPKLKMSGETSAPPAMRVMYSRPQKKGRDIFGNLQKYGQPWRLGANEATEIEFFKNVTIQGKPVSAGRYVIYCIPEPKEWNIVLNSHLFSWGLHFDSTKDIQHFKIPVESTKGPVEYFTMTFLDRDKGASLVMAWDTVMAKLPIEF